MSGRSSRLAIAWAAPRRPRAQKLAAIARRPRSRDLLFSVTSLWTPPWLYGFIKPVLTRHHRSGLLNLQSKTQDSLGLVLATRSGQIGVRLGISFAVAVCYGWFIGWPVPTLWFLIYGAVQGLERFGVSGPRPWFGERRAGGAAPAPALALALIATSSGVFGALALANLRDPVAEACAVYLIAGSIFNALLTTINCRAAFIASLLPLILYLCLISLAAAALPQPAGHLVPVGISLGGWLSLGSAIRLWRGWSRAKQAEIAATERDHADRLENEQRLFRLAHFDTLTGLPNRTVLQMRLNELVSSDATGALLMIDLDGFKYVNDMLGHSAGDKVLREVADRLVESARPGDVTARLAGDEFALLLLGVDDVPLATEIGNRMITAVSQPILVDERWIDIGASVGIALYPMHGGGVEELLSSADLALYQAKAEGRHCSRFYTPALRSIARGRMSRAIELARALEQGEFELFYQPQVRLADRAIIGAEALLRWRHPVEGLLTPAAFLHALDGGRLAADLGDWVVDTACRQAAEWRREGAPDFRMAVNLFSVQFRSADLVTKMLDIISKYDLQPEALEIEITENVILSHEDTIVAPLRQLRALGVSVAFDDYGTGYASLSLLKRYPLTHLKIDQSFTRAMSDSPADAAIVQAIISLARAFELQVIAEGIENVDQAELVTQYGCEEAQGYFFGKPMSSTEFASRFLQKKDLSVLV